MDHLGSHNKLAEVHKWNWLSNYVIWCSPISNCFPVIFLEHSARMSQQLSFSLLGEVLMLSKTLRFHANQIFEAMVTHSSRRSGDAALGDVIISCIEWIQWPFWTRMRNFCHIMLAWGHKNNRWERLSSHWQPKGQVGSEITPLLATLRSKLLEHLQ
jgi:hypothetical protein